MSLNPLDDPSSLEEASLIDHCEEAASVGKRNSIDYYASEHHPNL